MQRSTTRLDRLGVVTNERHVNTRRYPPTGRLHNEVEQATLRKSKKEQFFQKHATPKSPKTNTSTCCPPNHFDQVERERGTRTEDPEIFLTVLVNEVEHTRSYMKLQICVVACMRTGGMMEGAASCLLLSDVDGEGNPEKDTSQIQVVHVAYRYW